MKRILYVHHTFRDQSYNSLLFEFARRVDRRRLSVYVSCLREGGPYERRFKDIGLHVTNFNMRSVFDIRIFPVLVRFIRQNKIDAVHTALLPADFYGRLAARMAGVRLIFSTIHNIDDYRLRRKFFLYQIADRLSMLCATRVIAVSKAVEGFISQWPEVRSKICTIYNGIDSKKFALQVDLRSFKRELGLRYEIPTVGVTARLTDQKGLAFLLTAARYVLETGREAEFLIVGDGPLKAALERYAKELGISKSVVFTGFRRDVPEILAILDVFVLPSLWEGLPISVIEAMFSGKPVVATQVHGTPEAVVDGQTGWLIPPRDPRILAEKIMDLLDSPQKRRDMGQKGRRRALEQFSIEKMVKCYEEFYDWYLE